MTMSKLPNPVVDRIERDHLKYSVSFMRGSRAFILVGLVYLAMIVGSYAVGASRHDFLLVRGAGSLLVALVGVLAAVWPVARDRYAARRALSQLPSMSMSAATRFSGQALLRGRIRCIEPGLSFVFHDPESPGIVGWIEDPDLSVWNARGGEVRSRSSADAIYIEDDVTLQAQATELTDVPPMLQRWLSESSYREPPKVIHLTCSVDEPLRIVVNH